MVPMRTGMEVPEHRQQHEGEDQGRECHDGVDRAGEHGVHASRRRSRR